MRRQVVWLAAACALLLIAAVVSLGVGTGQGVRTVDGYFERAESAPAQAPDPVPADPVPADPVPADPGLAAPAPAGPGAVAQPAAAPPPEQRPAPETPPAQPAAPEAEPARRGATHVRLLVTATTTADWATVALDGLTIVDHVVRSGAAQVAVAESTLTLPSGRAQTARSTTVDLLLAVADDQAPALVIDQARRPGTATTVVVERVAPDGGRAPMVEAVADLADGPMTVPLDVAALTAAPIDLGPSDPERLAVMMVHPWWDGSEAGRFGPGDPVGAWTWDDPADAAAQVDAIAGLGVDAIAFSFGFPDDLAGDPMITNLIDAVVADGRLRLLPLIELDAAENTPAVIDRQIDQAWGFARTHREQFVWRGGAPAFFFYGDERLATFMWNGAIARSQNRGQPVYAIIGAVEEGRHRSGSYRYSLAGSTPEAITQDVVAQTFRMRVSRVLRPELGPAQLSVASVSPGYDERLIANRPRQLLVPRDDGRRYDQAWDAALAGDPDWVFISTWDEWFEQSQVHPDTEHGDRAYRQTADWVARFHAGG